MFHHWTTAIDRSVESIRKMDMVSIASLLPRLPVDSVWAGLRLGDRIEITARSYAGLHARLAFVAIDDGSLLLGLLLEPRGELIWWLNEDQVEICNCSDANSAPMPDRALATGVLQQLIISMLRDGEHFGLTTITGQRGRIFRANLDTQDSAPQLLLDLTAHGRDPLEALGALMSRIFASELRRP